MSLASLAFLSPWVLAALLVLPVLWWLLRAVPPAPRRLAFPGVRLLLGLKEKERMPARTPWWLLLLRMLALAAVIIAFSQPVLNPDKEGGSGPLVILLDGGWGDATDWPARQERIAQVLVSAERNNRPVALFSLAAAPPAEFDLPLRAASDWQDRIAGLNPVAWAPDRGGWADWFEQTSADFDTVWLSDGLDHGDETILAAILLKRGDVTVLMPEHTTMGLTPAWLEQGELHVGVLRSATTERATVPVVALGPDPGGVMRVLGRATAEFGPGEARVDLPVVLPLELRNRVEQIRLADERSAAGVVLTDDGVKRRKVGLLSGAAQGEAQDLVDPLNYLRKALVPFAEIIEAPLTDMFSAAPEVLMLADVGELADAERQALVEWVTEGGVLVRFAGPRLAQSGVGQLDADPLLPVRLRAGGRSLGGAMSWGAPRHLQPFADTSPFFGLDLPDDVEISAQVMAQPDPDLAARVMAGLEDGTPLVTGQPLGAGQVVLFHVTASAEWSNLPLSGLFVQMLERLTRSAGNTGDPDKALEGVVWTPEEVLDGFGVLEDAGRLAGVPGEILADGMPSSEVPPGIYSAGDRRIALNVMGPDTVLRPLEALPPGVIVESMEREGEQVLGPWFLAVALGLLALDVIATLLVSGRFPWPGRRAASIAGLLVAFALLPVQSDAQDDAQARLMANETVLAYVMTGNARQDQISHAGLRGLSQALTGRTAIEPGEPVGVDPELDDLSLLPIIYWPVSVGQEVLSDAAYGRLNGYLRHGGMILFDTLDSDLGAGYRGTTPNGQVLQRIALRLDIPPLAPVPADHVLTRTFYLISNFPGRWAQGNIWAEAAQDTSQTEGLPFRNLNDGVTPVVIGGNDWASAWAIDETGRPMFPVGRGVHGERQREIALRFGINLVMHVMTGNYKSDQVHVPALLDRLGQ